jgi:hypothetical protein
VYTYQNGLAVNLRRLLATQHDCLEHDLHAVDRLLPGLWMPFLCRL